MTVDQTRVNQFAAVQQAQTILLLATWKRLVFSVLAYLTVPAAVFQAVFDATGQMGGWSLAAWVVALPVVHLVSKVVPETSLEEVARQFEAPQRAAALRGPSLAERIYPEQRAKDGRDGDLERRDATA